MEKRIDAQAVYNRVNRKVYEITGYGFLAYDVEVIAERMQSMQNQINRCNPTSWVSMLLGLSRVWQVRVDRGLYRYNSPQYNAVEVVCLAMRSVAGDLEVEL